MALTDKEIQALQPREKRYKVTDRDGLYLLPDVGVADSNCPFRGHGRADYSRRNDLYPSVQQFLWIGGTGALPVAGSR